MSKSSIDAKLASIASLTEELLAHRRLIIASNRGPLEYKIEADGSLSARRGSGGMVTALMATARFVPMTWVASAMTDGDRRAAVEAESGTVKVPDYEIYVRFVTVPQPVYQRHYYVICNPLLWFIQHYMWNTPRTPNIGRVVYEAWDNGYVPTNQAIADAIVAEADKEDEPPVVLLQDYHLYLAPKMIRERMPEATILHFTHIPWPGPRYWGMLPEFMRRGIHEHMAASDIVGLQTMSDVQNFLHSCDTMLDSDVDYHACTVDFEGHRTHVRAYPISVDADGLLEFSKSAEVQRSIDKLKPLLGEKTILRVDRSEPSKNIIRGLRAHELLLERYPEFRGSVNFLQLLVPSRSDLGVYQTYTDEIFELVDSINDHFGEMDWQPIRVFYEDDYTQAIAAMTLYDVLLVNPVIDGMNLVSKEGPLVNANDGVLILSELAGAYEQLREHVLPVAPTDLEGTVRALHQALTMPSDERRRRSEALRQIVIDEDIIRWLEHQLSDLTALSRGAL
ncbi:MAG: trehalose-6-phosphate synthase [Chloroflexi bacterium]|nr:trehalose-6-phosphate synthase [Chloroflexota bacterium]MCI0884258.1 trehalose-6-phosphate synthase [Chloroflexota bacterium]